jgi:hypothetical protein
MISNMSTTTSHQPSSDPWETMDNLVSRWQHGKQNAAVPQRLGMRLLEVIALAGAMFIVPTGFHRIVQSVDEVYELLGRRARSPYAPQPPLMSIVVATMLLAGWHIWLGRLSYKAIMEDEDDKTRDSKQSQTSWGRILGRIVIPLVLLSFGLHFVYMLFDKSANPAPFVTPNMTDGKEIEWELKGSR